MSRHILQRLEAVAYIPNLNGSDRLADLLESLDAQTVRCRTVVVDNGSTDDSVAMVRERYPDVGLVEIGENLGFGRALNRALAQDESEAFFLLNNDVICSPDFFERMLARLEPGVDAVAGLMTRADDPGVIDSAGVVADRRTLMAFDYLRGFPVAAAEGAPAPLAPCGGAALFRREAFDRAGRFDERIFAYYEDLDLALRLRLNGSRCALAPDARVTHLHSATLGNASARKYALTGWGRGYLLRRYGVMRKPANALRTIFWESIVCGGQVLLDHTAAGIRGRVNGWRAARGLPDRSLPGDGLLELSTRRAIRNRIRERWGRFRP